MARLLETDQTSVLQLLEEGRLAARLLAVLQRKGVSATPTVKNSVSRAVSQLKIAESASAPPLGAPALPGSEATVTILFTDIVGSTELVEKLGDRRARVVLAVHDEIVRRHTSAHGGTEVKSIGDGFMLVFKSAHRGVACAVAIQRELEESRKDAGQQPVEVRMGLTVGEPVHDDADLFGKSVITASRIAEQAKGGQVLVSEIVKALVGSSGEFQLGPMGEFALKGMLGTQPLYEVTWTNPR